MNEDRIIYNFVIIYLSLIVIIIFDELPMCMLSFTVFPSASMYLSFIVLCNNYCVNNCVMLLYINLICILLSIGHFCKRESTLSKFSL